MVTQRKILFCPTDVVPGIPNRAPELWTSWGGMAPLTVTLCEHKVHLG